MNDFDDDFEDGWDDPHVYDDFLDFKDKNEKVKSSTNDTSSKDNSAFTFEEEDFLLDDFGEFEEGDEPHDWYEEEEIIPADPYVLTAVEQTENLDENTVLLDADNYAFQFRNGEWFMAGATYGATEFSGSFPARKLR